MAYGAILNQRNYFTKEETINDDVMTLFGVDENTTPSDLFLMLKLGDDTFAFKLTVYYPDGITPYPGLTLGGVTDVNGGAAVTDDNGKAIVLANSANPTITATSTFIDIQNLNQQISKNDNYFTEVAISTQTVQYVQYTKNATIQRSQISPVVKTMDFTVVGAGQGGEEGVGDHGGNGGNAGQIQSLLNADASDFQSFNIVIGKGGVGGNGDKDITRGNGTNTTITFDSSSSIAKIIGRGGTNTANNGGAGGEGANGDIHSGATHSGRSGGSNSIHIFNDESLGLAGGGGGGGGGGTTSGKRYSAGGGGSPNGRRGTTGTSAPSKAERGGGGGGGGYATGQTGSVNWNNSYPGGEGGDGIVYFRFKYV